MSELDIDSIQDMITRCHISAKMVNLLYLSVTKHLGLKEDDQSVMGLLKYVSYDYDSHTDMCTIQYTTLDDKRLYYEYDLYNPICTFHSDNGCINLND